MGDAAELFEEAPIEIRSVPDEMICEVWLSQIEMIEKGLSRGQGDDVSSNDMLASILTGKNRLLVVHRVEDIIAIVVLSVIETPKKTKLFVELIAGRDFPLWIDHLQEVLVNFKESIGADCVEASCRPGLEGCLSKIGWSKKATIMGFE